MVGGGSSDVYGGGRTFPPLQRWSSTGTPDSSFAPSVGINPVFTIAPALDATNDVYIGGGFSGPNRIIRLNQDGTPDNIFDVGTGFDDDVTSIVSTTTSPASYARPTAATRFTPAANSPLTRATLRAGLFVSASRVRRRTVLSPAPASAIRSTSRRKARSSASRARPTAAPISTSAAVLPVTTAAS
jgi:hypothetical protein